MQSVLIIGNVTKDIYLRLDNRSNHFEEDQNGTNWLDIAFDGSHHDYYSRVSIYGGASISLEILTRFGLDANISGTPATFLDGQFIAKDVRTSYRYILCQDENSCFIGPSEPRASTWEAPTKSPDWIYIDYSANITQKLANEVLNYLQLSSSTKLAICVSQKTDQDSSFIRELIDRANLIISNVTLRKKVENHIFADRTHIEYCGERVFWQLDDKKDQMTKYSRHLTVAASVFGALALGKDSSEALLLARANIERSSLSATASLSTLESEIADEYYRVEKTPIKDQNIVTIEENARKLVAKYKGILAADESGGSIHKKFESMNIPDDEQHRRDYRNIFFTTPELENYVNGVILFEETAHQLSDDGKNFVEYLKDKGIIPGIKVDQGLEPLDGSDEKYTKGLEGLSERLENYYKMGARFAKWRAAFEVTDHSPSAHAVEVNADILAQYAIACQKASIVPIVEPELVYDGDYTIEQSIEYTGKILDCLFDHLAKYSVDLPGCILKVNMVLAGKKQAKQSTPAEVGRATAQVLRQHVPGDLAGVVFLSGGQSVEQATDNLKAVTDNGPFPWPVTFSYARALQDPALQAWRGDNANADAARAAFKKRLIANCEALKG